MNDIMAMGRNAAMKNNRKIRRETRLCKLLTFNFMFGPSSPLLCHKIHRFYHERYRHD